MRAALIRLSALLAALAVLAGGASRAEPLHRVAAGITQPFKDETLSFAVPGTVETVHVEEGETVHKGDALVDLDSDLEELELARRKLVWESRIELEAAEARVATFKADLAATQKLFDTTKSVSRDELEKKRLEYKLAEAEAESLRVAEQREQIEVDMAAVQLRRRTLRAPITGIVTKLYLEEGENCEPRQPILRIVDVSKCYFVANVEAAAARALQSGMAVALLIEAGEAPVSVTGKVAFAAPVVDPASGLQEIKILFDNRDGSIRPGVAGVLQFDTQDE